MTLPFDELVTVAGTPVTLPAPPAEPVHFTVIVRTQGRRPRSLSEAIEALAAQTHRPFDVIVAVHVADQDLADQPRADQDRADQDRADQDRAEQLVDDVQASLAGCPAPDTLALVPVTGGGRSRPLNHALDRATGDHVCFLDDDDLVTPDWLAAFARGAAEHPGQVIRAVTESQKWTADGGVEPVRALGPVERPFPERFDLLAHLSVNQTPICSIAVPRLVLDRFDIRFSEDLPVFEDWDLLMRVAMLTGVASVPEATSLYRRLDHGNADTATDEAAWRAAHATVIERLSSRPLLLPTGSAQRLASAHFLPGAGSRWETDHAEARAELDRITKSPVRWAAAFLRRLAQAARRRVGARAP